MASIASLPGTISRIVLIGFMGAGKSTVGALLAARLQWDFLDADSVLEKRAGSTIAEFFSHQGEAAFRQLETDVIHDLLRKDKLVLAVGGGAVEAEGARDAILNTPETCVVFLQAPLSVMIDRCEQQTGGAIRPILQDREGLLTRFETRLPHYRKAHLTIDTASLSPESTALRIIETARLLLENSAKENTLA